MTTDTILIVDDDPGVIILIESVLREEGYSLLAARDGFAAKEIIESRSSPLAAILLDWQMPKMTGIELLRWIKQQRPFENTPVIMETAMDTAESLKEGIDAGAFYYLVKPFNRSVLLSIVQAAVSDFRFKESLLKRLKESENPFGLLVEGSFRFQSMAEGERLALWIANACPSPAKAMGISEIIINAVEHGNLGITYEEKTRFISEGTWETEVERRLRSSENCGKYVHVRIRRNATNMAVRIEDEGLGFEYARFLEFDESRVFHTHGRGIAMAKANLDLQYLGSGNTVLVTIPFEQ